MQPNMTYKNYTKMSIPKWAFISNDFDVIKIGGYEYHSRWVWLMPVVNKFINETIRPTESRDINEYRDYCNRLHNLVTDYKIMPVFNCLAKAIKWYNKNNNQ